VAGIDACGKPEECVYETVKRLYPHDVPEIFAEEKKPARLLPQVHRLWPHLVASLGARLGPPVQPEAFKASLAILVVAARVSGGQFIARRIATDLWPNLARLLRAGVAHTEVGADSLSRRMDMLYLGGALTEGVDVNGAPQKTEAVRRAILACVGEIASDVRGRAALTDVAAAAAAVILPFATGSPSSQSPGTSFAAEGTSAGRGGGSRASSTEIRRLAAEAVQGLSALDEDAVWSLLMLSATGNRAMPIPVAPTWAHEQGGEGGCTIGKQSDRGGGNDGGNGNGEGANGGFPLDGQRRYTAFRPISGEYPVTLPTFREILPLSRSEEVPIEVAQASLRLMAGCGFVSPGLRV